MSVLSSDPFLSPEVYDLNWLRVAEVAGAQFVVIFPSRGALTFRTPMASETSGQLRRVLGLGFGLAVSVGGTIGVGILRTPGLIAEQFQSPFAIILLWIAGGIYTCSARVV
jgi:hypothetical protein